MADAQRPDVLIVARANNYGLTRDSTILQRALAATGIRAECVATRQRSLLEAALGRRRARVVLHVERVHRRWLGAGEENWLVPNQERFPRRHLGRLARIDRVLAKTRHAEIIFRDTAARSVIHTGFTSEDRHDPSVTKEWMRFFHMAGGNTLKGTEALIDLWARHPEWPELALRQKPEQVTGSLPANVMLYGDYMADGELRTLQNHCGVHLCPSQAEGWGHHIVEAMSTGAVTLTTDAPPMNELVNADCGMLVAAQGSEPRHLGRRFFVDPAALERTVQALIDMPADAKARLGDAARARYREIDQAFGERLASQFRP